MHVTGIIAEYNPFHNGHARMIEAVRQRLPGTAVIALMSGSFTQRGEPAILDKWQRAMAAICGGCDLVLELPFVFAVRSAQDFARGAVLLLERLGIATHLAFGIEHDDIQGLQHCAKMIDAPCLQEKIHAGLQEGHSYAEALTEALAAETGMEKATLKQPNTILALEYLRSLHLTGSSMEPVPIQRQGAGHKDTDLLGSISSASAIRKEAQKNSPAWDELKTALPPASFDALWKDRNSFPQADMFHKLLLSSLYRMNLPQLREIHGINEGMEHRILSAAREALSLPALLDGIASRRYPRSRIQRVLAHLLFGFAWEQASSFDRCGPQYVRVLAFNDTGRMLLRGIRNRNRLPLITKTSRFLRSADLSRLPDDLPSLQRMMRFDCLGTDMRELCRPIPIPCGKDFLQSPLYMQ